MKIVNVACMVFVLGAAVRSGNAASMQDLIYQGSKASDMAIFHGEYHLNRGYRCDDCHNRNMFPKKQKGAVKITMKAIQEGKLCGKCHNGKIAFGLSHNCKICHPQNSTDTVIYD